MWYILFKAVVTVLVIYAVINIISKLVRTAFFPEPYNNRDSYIVIRVKNQEKNIEGIVRSVIWHNLKMNSGGYVPSIIIVDSGSDDTTKDVCEKLSEQYSFIFYTTDEDFEKMKAMFGRNR